MSKFISKYNHYLSLYSENVDTFTAFDIKEGDVVKFKSDCFSQDYMKNLENTTTGQRIKEMMESENNLIVSGIKSVNPTAFGAYGNRLQNQINNENFLMATVIEQYSDGLHKNVVEVPMTCLDRVDTGINLPPISDEQRKDYHVSYKGEDVKMNPNTPDPQVQTHASWNDHGGPLPGEDKKKKKKKSTPKKVDRRKKLKKK